MKAVVFAAGEGVRMRPLTLYTPKPLLKYQGKTNLDHIFNLLPQEVDEVILVVKYLADMIKDYCGKNFYGRRIHYVEGSEKGNAIGFMAARSLIGIGERFAVAYGDEVFVGDEIARCFHYRYSWLCYHVADPTKVGIATLNDRGRIIEVNEKPDQPKSNLAADGFMIVNADIFNCEPEQHSNGEYYFSSMMNKFLKDHEVFAVMASEGHAQLSTPADIEKLDKVI